MKKRRKESPSGVSQGSLTAEWQAWWAGKKPVLVFGAKFGGLLLLFSALLALPAAEKTLYYYLEVNAWVSNLILNLLGQGTQVSEVTIRSADFAIAIRRGCDALEPAWLLCAAILAFPGAWKQKLIGMAIGVAALQLLNLVRIVTLFGIGQHAHSFFDMAHLEIWPTIFIIAAILLFVGWKGWADER